MTLLVEAAAASNLMRINLEGRNSCCSTKITNDDGHHFVASKSIATAAMSPLCNCNHWTRFFLVVLPRPVSHSPLENNPSLLGTKTELLQCNLMGINLEGRNSCCSTKITNDYGHHFVASKSITAAAMSPLCNCSYWTRFFFGCSSSTCQSFPFGKCSVFIGN